MGDVYVNGRLAADWEVPVIERGRRCERDRDLQVLAGVLSGEPAPPRFAGRLLDDLPILP